MHCMKCTDLGFKSFGEAYVSIVQGDYIKAWKCHTRMYMNLVVPQGNVQFAFYDNDLNFRSEIVGTDNYVRVTVPPGIWFGCKGLEKPSSMVLNFANIVHDPDECLRRPLDYFNFFGVN